MTAPKENEVDELPKGLKHLCDQGEDYIWRPATAAVELIEKLQAENAALKERLAGWRPERLDDLSAQHNAQEDSA